MTSSSPSADPGSAPVTAPVTACIISFNEQDNIADCLDSLAFCRHRIVVDSHSTDDTRAIAEGRGARVLTRDWPGHIDQKNFAIDQAETEWVLCIDADERVSPALRERLLSLFADGEPPRSGYEVHRRTFYLGRFIDHGGFYPDRKLRLFRRSRGRWRGTNPHDHVMLEGDEAPGVIAADLIHYSYRDIADHLRTIDYFTTIIAREKHARGRHRLLALKLLVGPPWKFIKMYLVQRGFLDGAAGFMVAALGAVYVFLKYAKLWELIAVRGEEAGGGGEVRYERRGVEGR